MYDVCARTVVGEFSQLVRPEHLPLTRFCTATTGISSDDAEIAEPLPQVLASHASWVQSLTGHPLNVLLVTCGDFLCDALIPRQCQRVPMPVPESMQKWVNIKQVFELVYPRKAGPIVQMCEHIGIPASGPAHHAMADCRLMVCVLEHLFRPDGGGLDASLLNGTTVISERKIETPVVPPSREKKKKPT
jgi:inhibitor of KinA sporulation pathway (predicted exonuclease)